MPSPSLDIVSWRSPIQNCLCAPTAQLYFHGRTPYRLSCGKEKMFQISWKDQFQFLNIHDIKAITIREHRFSLIRAVATVEQNSLVYSQDGCSHATDLQFKSNSHILVFPEEDNSELDDREKLRRTRISKANKGNVPWNKGRKHTPETLRRIRERTRLAMQDPKVKMKLMNIGHAQSEETRVKIGLGVREGWQRRREKLMVQQNCCIEWQNKIAEASRLGFSGQEEFQWDSYKILDKELKKQWLQSIENRKVMPRPKGSKRAPKSLEQRRKISEAISAKWSDPEYRERVCSALAKYHGTTDGAERKPRRRRTIQDQSDASVSVKKKPVGRGDTSLESQVIKKTTSRKKKAPMYKDPMASTKLEMIKKIKAQRTEMETRKREATERAKLLIAEAEKAANALEVAALTSPLARASLFETRKLIAEATRSIESIERGETTPQDTSKSTSQNWNVASGHRPVTPDAPIVNNTFPVAYRANGIHQLSPSDQSTEFDRLTPQDAVNGSLPLPDGGHPVSSSGETINHKSPCFMVYNASEKSEGRDNFEGLPRFHEIQSWKGDEKKQEGQQTKVDVGKTTTTSKTKKKWVCGRLVEVEED